MPTRYQALRSGFTLIEVLVVITVISILIAMLLPAMGAAKAVAQGVVCQSNQKQYYAGFDVYSYDFKQYYPPFYPQSVAPPTPAYPAAECISWPKLMDKKKYFPSLFKDPAGPEWAGNLMGIHRCPTLQNTATVTTTSYGMNYWLASVGTAPSEPGANLPNIYRSGAGPAYGQLLYNFRRDWLRSPNSDTLLFGDIKSEYAFPSLGHNFDSLMQTDFRHANFSVNITYLDGHGANMKSTNTDMYFYGNRLWNYYWFNTLYPQ